MPAPLWLCYKHCRRGGGSNGHYNAPPGVGASPLLVPVTSTHLTSRGACAVVLSASWFGLRFGISLGLCYHLKLSLLEYGVDGREICPIEPPCLNLDEYLLKSCPHSRPVLPGGSVGKVIQMSQHGVND